MDTKQMEIEAEYYITSLLNRFDFLVSKPMYDREGCDLQIIDNQKSPSKLLRVQSKGRTFSNSTQVEIPTKYVDDTFVLILYLRDELKNEFTFIFFNEDIKKFKINNNNYILYCSKASFIEEYKYFQFTSQIEKLRENLLKDKIKYQTTLIIDRKSLDQSIANTRNFYVNYYPQKEIIKPKLIDVIKEIIRCYDKSEHYAKTINVFLFNSLENEFEKLFFKSEELIIRNNKIRIFELNIDGDITIEIEDYLRRVIDSENIILTINEISFTPLLKILKEEGKDIVLVCEKNDNGLREHGFYWGKIDDAIARTLNLLPGEI
jgi:hypothetical protein